MPAARKLLLEGFAVDSDSTIVNFNLGVVALDPRPCAAQDWLYFYSDDLVGFWVVGSFPMGPSGFLWNLPTSGAIASMTKFHNRPVMDRTTDWWGDYTRSGWVKSGCWGLPYPQSNPWPQVTAAVFRVDLIK